MRHKSSAKKLQPEDTLSHEIQIEIAQLWKAFVGGIVMHAGAYNQKSSSGVMTIEPMSMNTILVHLSSRSIALFAEFGKAEGRWQLRELEQPVTEGSWLLAPNGIIIDIDEGAVSPLEAAGAFLALLEESQQSRPS